MRLFFDAGKDSDNASTTTTAGISGMAGDTAKRTGDNAQGILGCFAPVAVNSRLRPETPSHIFNSPA
jgi:hypothetical protein